MRAHGRAEFAAKFAEKAADSDYSSHSRLQGIDQFDIKAAAEALWAFAGREGLDIPELDENMVITALLAQEKTWADDGELVSVEFEEYWDITDDQEGLSFDLRQQIKRELAAHFLSEKRESHVVVNNGDGIWIFRKADMWSGHGEG